MLNYKTVLVANLSEATSLPVYYELICDSNTPKPCITYTEKNNYDIAVGDTRGDSMVSFYIKLWGNTLSTMEPYAALIDAAMRGMGFFKVSYNELAVDSQLCMIWVYEGLGEEIYTVPNNN